MDQKDAAAKAGISQSHFSHIEAGKKVPSLDGLKRIADALDCSPSELLNGLDLSDASETENSVSEAPIAERSFTVEYEIEGRQMESEGKKRVRFTFPIGTLEEQMQRAIKAVMPEDFGFSMPGSATPSPSRTAGAYSDIVVKMK